MTDADQPDAKIDLAKILLENNLLSQAQIDLAVSDQKCNDLPLEEILLVRGWITEDKLYGVAPWLKPGSKQQAPGASSAKSGPAKAGAVAGKNAGQAKTSEPAKQSSTAAARAAQQSPAKTGESAENKSASDGPRLASSISIESPVKSDREQNLRAYKEVLKKILAVDRDS